MKIRAKIKLVDVARAEIRTNLEGDPRHSPRLDVTTVERWATKKLNVDPQREI